MLNKYFRNLKNKNILKILGKIYRKMLTVAVL